MIVRVILCVICCILGGALSVAAASQPYAAIVVDAKTGEVLHETDADGHRYPASLTKMMTLYLLFEALDSKKISLNTRMKVPHHAPHVEPCKMGLRAGQQVMVRDLMMGMITKSANDASVTVAVALGQSIAGFAKRMNTKAKHLGMHRTHFTNPHGLPDTRQKSTARDLARLSHALIHHFPHYYHLFNTRSFRYNNQLYNNHNHLLKSFAGLDGIKTGYFKKAGSNLAASAVRYHNGKPRRMIAIALGCNNRIARDMKVSSLLEAGFKSPQNILSRPRVTWMPYGSSPKSPHRMPSSSQVQHDADPMGDLIQSKILATPTVVPARAQQTLNKKNKVAQRVSGTRRFPRSLGKAEPQKASGSQKVALKRRAPKPLKAA